MDNFVLDIRTLLLVLSIIFVCRAVLLAYAWAINRSYLPIRYWAIGSSLAGFGVLMLSLRGMVPLAASVMLGQAGLIFGWMTITAGTMTFRILAFVLSASIVSNLLKHFYALRSGSGSMFDVNAHNSQYFVLGIVILIACTVLYVLLAEQKSQELLAQEVEQRKRAEEQIRDLVYYDSLTDLPNRRMLTERLDLAIAGGKRTGTHGAVMLIDLDNFKPLNDKHGHAAGDLLLIEVARRLRQNVREIDTVARLGGDEFIVLLASLHVDQPMSKTQALAIADKLRAKLAEPYLLISTQEGGTRKSIEHHCSASIGVTLFCGEIVNQNDLIRRADDAMYRAKNSGRNSISFFPVAS